MGRPHKHRPARPGEINCQGCGIVVKLGAEDWKVKWCISCALAPKDGRPGRELLRGWKPSGIAWYADNL